MAVVWMLGGYVIGGLMVIYVFPVIKKWKRRRAPRRA